MFATIVTLIALVLVAFAVQYFRRRKKGSRSFEGSGYAAYDRERERDQGPRRME